MESKMKTDDERLVGAALRNAAGGIDMPESTAAKACVRRFQTGKDRPRLTRDQKRAARRVKELSRIYYQQFPSGLPRNGQGVAYARYMCRTMAFLPDDRRVQRLERHAAWMNPKTRDYILALGAYWYYDRSLGNHLELHDEDRERCKAWSIEAIDVTEEQRRLINKEKNRQAQERCRRKNGAKPREQSLSRTQPWKAEGISKRTWERRRKASDANSSRPSLILSTNDELASSAPSKSAEAISPVPSSQSQRPAWPGEVSDPGIVPGGIWDLMSAFEGKADIEISGRDVCF
jgi:hypothetical protein